MVKTFEGCPDCNEIQAHDPQGICQKHEIEILRKALADIYNRLPILGTTEPVIASGLCYDIGELALNGLALKRIKG